MAYKQKRYVFKNAIEIEEYHTARYGAPGMKRLGKRKPTPEQIEAAVRRSQSSGDIYMKLMAVATHKTALADVRYDDSGNRIDPDAEDQDELENDASVVIVKRD